MYFCTPNSKRNNSFSNSFNTEICAKPLPFLFQIIEKWMTLNQVIFGMQNKLVSNIVTTIPTVGSGLYQIEMFQLRQLCVNSINNRQAKSIWLQIISFVFSHFEQKPYLSNSSHFFFLVKPFEYLLKKWKEPVSCLWQQQKKNDDGGGNNDKKK